MKTLSDVCDVSILTQDTGLSFWSLIDHLISLGIRYQKWLTMAKNFLSSLMNCLPRALRPQNSDMESIILWSGASVVGTFWLIQPWDWLSEQIFGLEEKKWVLSGGLPLAQRPLASRKNLEMTQRNSQASAGYLKDVVINGGDVEVAFLEFHLQLVSADRSQANVKKWGCVAKKWVPTW